MPAGRFVLPITPTVAMIGLNALTAELSDDDDHDDDDGGKRTVSGRGADRNNRPYHFRPNSRCMDHLVRIVLAADACLHY